MYSIARSLANNLNKSGSRSDALPNMPKGYLTALSFSILGHTIQHWPFLYVPSWDNQPALEARPFLFDTTYLEVHLGVPVDGRFNKTN